MRPRRRPARRLLSAGAVVLAAALAAAGCGGSAEKNSAYIDRVNLTQTQFAATFNQLLRGIATTSTPAQDRKTLRAMDAATAKTVTGLRAIHPPDKVKTLHADLVDAVAGYSDAIANAEQSLSGTAAQATRAQTQLKTDTDRASTQVTAAISAINQKLRE